MKVQKLHNTQPNKLTPQKQTSFKGGAAAVVKDAKYNWYTRLSLGVNNIKGEKLTSGINALSKAIIAPLMIVFNPFSKEDKDTKVYSAFKHPIEAIVTFSIQLLALSRVDNYIDKLSEKGKLLGKDLNKKGLAKDSEALKIVKNRLDGYKALMGFVAALAVIPIATNIVNWSYPKIMKLIQPQAYAKRKEEND